NAGNPGIEIDEHLLKTEEVPRRLRRIHRQVWIRRFFQRCVKRDRPDKQNDRDDQRRQKLYAYEIWPNVNLARPARTPWLDLAVMRLRGFRILLEILDEPVVGYCLSNAQPREERDQKQHRDDRH